jgi:hypothetical protein
VIEVPVVAGANSQHPALLPEPGDRSVHHLREDRVVHARRGLLRGGELALQNRPPGLDDRPERAFGPNLTTDVPLGDTRHRPATEEPPPLVEDPAVGGVGAEKLDQLVDQALDDSLEAQVGCQHLSGLQERRLLLDAARVLLQELRRVQGKPDLACDGLGERDVAERPCARFGTMQPEHADHAVEHKDRSREHGPSTQLDHRPAPAQGRVVERG